MAEWDGCRKLFLAPGRVLDHARELYTEIMQTSAYIAEAVVESIRLGETPEQQRAAYVSSMRQTDRLIADCARFAEQLDEMAAKPSPTPDDEPPLPEIDLGHNDGLADLDARMARVVSAIDWTPEAHAVDLFAPVSPIDLAFEALAPISGGSPETAEQLIINGLPYLVEQNSAACLPSVRLISDKGKVYDVTQHQTGLECDCPDFTYRRNGLDSRGCKHTRAVADAGLFSEVKYAQPDAYAASDDATFVPTLSDEQWLIQENARRDYERRYADAIKYGNRVCRPERQAWEVESQERAEAGSQLGHRDY
jgi:hypothetical protein